jgi:aspartate-semialdehyde dehydrogenase
MKTAVVGATGLVGEVMLKVLEERNFPVSELILAASEKSVGKEFRFNRKSYKIQSVEEAISRKPDFAIFSAGSSPSLKYAPLFAETGTFVIDNSSAWRMHHDKKLIIPEINGFTLKPEDKIIANPNCSTIQFLMAVAPLHRKYKIKRLVVSTYQSVTGTGKKALVQLENEEKGIKGEQAYKHQIFRNCLPHCGDFSTDGYTTEETKMVNETHKILDSNIKITATAVRVPVIGGHSESVNIEFEKDFNLEDIRSLLEQTPGVCVYDDIQRFIYPMPLISEGKDEVFVGRIRRDFSIPYGLNLWIVSDNLRKGAATNAVQIAEYIIRNIMK